MSTHVKPTQEELDAQMAQSIAEAEALENTPEPDDETPETPKEDSEVDVEAEADETPEVEPEPAKKPKEEELDEQSELERVKEKAKHSRTEALAVGSRNEKMLEAFDKATQVPEPTEDELKDLYTDWDLMSDFEKKTARDTTRNNRRFEALEEVTKEFKDLKVWSDKVTGFLEDPTTTQKHQALEGKEEEFRIFATKPTRKGADLDDLVGTFLYTYPMKPKNKGSQIPTSTANSDKKGKPNDKLTLEEGQRLRQTDYKKWVEMNNAGKIDYGDL